MDYKYTYKNPWHIPRSWHDSGDEYYKTDKEPTKYKGLLIFHRVVSGWDVVKDDECITQRAGFNGAKRFIDDLTDGKLVRDGKHYYKKEHMLDA